MESVYEFFVDNYVWIVGLVLFILFTLIGFLADLSRKKKTKELQKQAVELEKKQEELKKAVTMAAPVASDTNVELVNDIVGDVSSQGVAEITQDIPSPVTAEDNNISDVNNVEEPKIDVPEVKDEYQDLPSAETTESVIKDEFEISPADNE